MMDKDKMAALGVPRLKNVMGAAMKAAGTAVGAGADKVRVARVVEAITHAADPAAAVPPDLAENFAPFVEALTEARRGRVFFTEGREPAPWQNWAQGELEASAVEQMKNACRLPVSAGGALMPDAHTGYGLPIGGVLAVRNAVIPYAVGVDIACRMRLTVLDMPVTALETEAARLAAAIEAETRFGVGAEFERRNRRIHPVMDLDWSVSPVTKSGKSKAAAQLGTSGSGNHFAEFGRLTVEKDIDEPGLSLKAGVYLALLSHSGSRGTGEAVAKHYSALAMSLHPELPPELRHLAWLELDSAEGREYWAAMELCGRYAAANHELIHRHVLENLGAGALAHVENHHNFAWREVWNGEEVIVHRKGATPAGEGVLGVVPGSMGSPGFVVRGKGSAASYGSCSHGAGRLMSRSAAFKKLSREKMAAILRERGVTLLTGPLDESPEVYKDIEAVIAAQSDLVDVLARFDPVIVKMAPGEKPPAWRCRPKKQAADAECRG